MSTFYTLGFGVKLRDTRILHDLVICMSLFNSPDRQKFNGNVRRCIFDNIYLKYGDISARQTTMIIDQTYFSWVLSIIRIGAARV